jgi:hypothetical protein
MKNPRVISLHQPFASLLAWGEKENETRPKATKHTIDEGTYIIQAANKWSKQQEKLCLQEPFNSIIKKRALTVEEFGKKYPIDKLNFEFKIVDGYVLPIGCILGSFDVEKCLTVLGTEYDIQKDEDFIILSDDEDNDEYLSKKSNEYAFGDYALFRSIWMGKNHRLFKNPVPYKGGQGYYQRFHGNINELKYKS